MCPSALHCQRLARSTGRLVGHRQTPPISYPYICHFCPLHIQLFLWAISKFPLALFFFLLILFHPPSLFLFPLVCLLHSFCLPLQGTKTMWQLTLLPALASINLRADTTCTHWRSTGRSSFSRPNKFFSKSHWNNLCQSLMTVTCHHSDGLRKSWNLPTASLVDTFFVSIQRIKNVQHYTRLYTTNQR